MRQLTFQNVSQNLHVAMRMRPKAAARLHAVFVDDPQAAKARVRRIVIIVERKGIARIQPPVIGMAALVAAANLDHVLPPLQGWMN